MPVVYIPAQGDIIPAILQHEDTSELLKQALALVSVPHHVKNISDLKIWLASQPAPAGWFETIPEFKAAVDAVANFQDATAEEIKIAREVLAPEGKAQLSQSAFMRLLNPEDSTANDNTLKANYQNIITGKRRLNVQKTLKLRALVASALLQKGKEE